MSFFSRYNYKITDYQYCGAVWHEMALLLKYETNPECSERVPSDQ